MARKAGYVRNSRDRKVQGLRQETVKGSKRYYAYVDHTKKRKKWFDKGDRQAAIFQFRL
jgi:hypothetical protein